MRNYFFKSALCVPDSADANQTAQWHSNVTISIEGGNISAVTTDTAPERDTEHLDGVAIPAMVNVHSHAFQRGFAGLSEFRTSANDSFWTWRRLMYDFVGKLNPDQVFVIARHLYFEMIAAGYSWVGEFHYLHNDANGRAFDEIERMSRSVLEAAVEPEIGICLLPVLYQRSGFDSNSVNEGQQRFALTNDQFCELMLANRQQIENLPNAKLGIAIHSLRAVRAGGIRRALKFREQELSCCPVHIHVAEQTQEIEDCVAATGKRSVEYLLSEFNVDPNWCLIHATHMNKEETRNLALTGAVAGLCPTTEANLGDGFFPASEFLAEGGKISIGSDSHCSVDLTDELRTLEYGARLQSRQRAILGTDAFSVGRRLYEAASVGGGQAIGVNTGKIASGSQADLLVIDDSHPTIAGAQEDRLLDRFIFVNAGNPIKLRFLKGKFFENDWIKIALRESSEDFLKVSKELLD